MELSKLIKGLEELANFEQFTADILEDNEKELAKIQTSQMSLGKNADGKNIGELQK